MLPTPATVSFLTSDVLSSPCIDVAIVDDMDYEGNHTFTMTIDAVTSPAIGSGDEVIVTILDNNGKKKSSFKFIIAKYDLSHRCPCSHDRLSVICN